MSSDDEADLAAVVSTASWTAEAILRTLDVAFRNQLTAQSPMIAQPASIQIPLRNHQRALVAAMSERERASISGIPYKNTLTYANYGVLGDEVGTGKSLVVLSYLAHLKEQGEHVQRRSILYPHSRSNFFTVYTKDYKDAVGSSLIVVPHTIYKQWQEYCKKQTSLNIYYVRSVKDLANGLTTDISGMQVKMAAITKSIVESDAVLVSNTLYSDLMEYAKYHGIRWKRMFIDETDTIYVPSTNPPPNAAFTWFITATWPNFIMEGYSIRPQMLEYYQTHQDTFTPELGTWLRSEIGLTTYAGYGVGRTTWLRSRSSRWLNAFRSDHGLRAMVLLMCSKAFLDESRQMPLIHELTLLCDQPATHRALVGLVSPQIQNMLHAGNIEGALTELGVSADTPMDLVEAAKSERTKELDRLQKTLAFKETMDYATPQAKEAALATLRGKIHSVQEQLKTFEERMANVTTEECPICYEDPNANSATLTPCCHRVFCASCILTSMTRGMTCPLCRAEIKTNQLVQLVKEKKKTKVTKQENKLLSKPKQLLKFLVDNPNARVLVFARYENPFVSLERDCEMQGITYHTLRGNKDVIAATIRSFEKGEKRVLFLPTESVGAGLNLVTATHVVLLHAMTPEEEKQAIGRAYRLGRTNDLQVVRLLHDGETVSTR